MRCRALIDRELYLPESWTDDRDRCRQAGIGDEVEFATKPDLARQMIARAVEPTPAAATTITCDGHAGAGASRPAPESLITSDDSSYIPGSCCSA